MKPPNEEHTVSESTNHVYPKAAAGEQSANVAPNPSFPKLEESVLDYWDKDDTFQKSIERRPSGDHSQNEFVFFDGPPFANGLPHYGHLLTGYAKDVIPRYQTMKGHKVNRVFGWDTHGLPAELEAQKELGIDSVDQVKEMGIDKFNDFLGRIFSVLSLAILAVIMCEVILRRIFNRPQIWTQDLIVMLFACYIILISAYGLQKKAFVAVDVVYAMFPVRVQHILHIVTYAIFLVPFLMGLVPASWTFFLNAYTTGEQTYSVWAAPTWPVKLCLFVGLVLLAIQAVSEILKHVEGLVTASANGKEAQG